MITSGELDGCMVELAQIMYQICIPIILALLLCDDSSYWLQLSSELIKPLPTLPVLQPIQQASQSQSIPSLNKVLTWTPKLEQSIGRFDSKANFNRVIDQLSMIVPVIKRSELIFSSDNNDAIGFGSYSAVKKAKYFKYNEYVAIKSLYSFNDSSYKYCVEFMREAFLSQRLKHLNIVDFRGVLIDKLSNSLCLVYEYMKYGSLFEYLTRNKIKYISEPIKYYQSVSLLMRIKFAIDAAKGIQCLHSHNIIHRDINCRNLLVTTCTTYNDDIKDDIDTFNNISLIVKLCDFGTCRQISANVLQPNLSYTPLFDSNDNNNNINNAQNIQMTTGIGTVAYMAPEILKYIDFSSKLKRINIRDKIEYDFGVDVYSFGCVLFEIMASKELYENLKTSKEVQNFVLNNHREKIPNKAIDTLNIPNSYIHLMYDCMHADSSKRPNFKEIIISLKHIAKSVKYRQ